MALKWNISYLIIDHYYCFIFYLFIFCRFYAPENVCIEHNSNEQLISAAIELRRPKNVRENEMWIKNLIIASNWLNG